MSFVYVEVISQGNALVENLESAFFANRLGADYSVPENTFQKEINLNTYVIAVASHDLMLAVAVECCPFDRVW